MTKEDQFETWWRSFPRGRRVGKGAARKKFGRIIEAGEATAEELIAAVVERRGIHPPPYECGPLVWLNQGRWEDDTPTREVMSPLTVALDKLMYGDRGFGEQ